MSKRIDITGQRFGRWTVLEYANHSKWLCKCDCGVERSVYGPDLKSGKSKSCGCYNLDALQSRALDLTGSQYGWLTVIEKADNIHGHTAWICRCKCGNIITTKTNNLRSGDTKSCGCYIHSKEWIPEGFNKTHGLTNHPLYNIWHGMRKRCMCANTPNYHRYGGRGIYICKEWEDFQKFYDWAISHGYKEGLTIDRIDNDGPYSPENCRWADVKTQSNNRNDNTYITYKGKTQTLTQWAEEYGLRPESVRYRYNSWHDIERALTQPMLNRNKKV